MKKKALIFALLIVFILTLSCDHGVHSKTLLKGGIRTIAKKGESINVKLKSYLNFYFSRVGDKVVCFIDDDIQIDSDTFIPKGSRVEGIITNIEKPKSFGRDGSFKIDFNEIVTPENISIPINASVTTDTKKSSEKIASILTYDAALISYGTFHGALGSIQYGGIPLAVASHGISLLAGAGIGAGAGIVGSAVRKGKLPTAIYGQQLPLVLNSDMYLLGDITLLRTPSHLGTSAPTHLEYEGFRFNQPLRKSELELTVLNTNKEHSKTYGNYVILDLEIINKSNKQISSTDIVLINMENKEQIHADLFLSGTKALNVIKPQNKTNTSLAFLISDDLDGYELAIVDSLNGKEIVRVPL